MSLASFKGAKYFQLSPEGISAGQQFLWFGLILLTIIFLHTWYFCIFFQVWVSLLTSLYASFANSSVLENWQDDSMQLPHPFVLGLILRFLSDVSPEIRIQLRLNAGLICNTKMWTVQITFCLLKKNHSRGVYEEFQTQSHKICF